ncbi:MAG: AAA family ATPase [Deltaproteobacteria bacterium]|nr:AAA family ATPase [Deltaproteobacteria bacterium]
METDNIKEYATKPLGVSVQDFPKLIDSGSLYVDKTSLIHKLITSNAPNYFFARPRRFGKTLLLSTIEDIFKNGQRRFHELDIVTKKLEYDWQTSPVISFNMSSCGTNAESLDSNIVEKLRRIASKNDISLNEKESAPAVSSLIERLYNSASRKITSESSESSIPDVAVLVDEYDFPLISNLDNPKNLKIVRDTLYSFYSALKSASSMIRFSLVTGITVFKEFSPYSGLNHLRDITFDKEYSALCGFTENEIKFYFGKYLENLFSEWSQINHFGRFKCSDDIFQSLIKWYDGYSWDGYTKVLNPISVNYFFLNKLFNNYWYNSGGPNFLEKLQLGNSNYFDMFNRNISLSGQMPSNELQKISPAAALLYTGYLTVKNIEIPNDPLGTITYRLGIPNYEVSLAFAQEYLIPNIYKSLSHDETISLAQLLKDFGKLFFAREAVKAEKKLAAIFAKYPFSWHTNLESFYKAHMLTALLTLDCDVTGERTAGDGIIDLLVEGRNGGDVMIVEVKYSKLKKSPVKSADPAKALKAVPHKKQTARASRTPDTQKKHEALLNSGITKAFNQIDDRDYAREFLESGRTVWAAAVSIVGRTNVKIEFRKLSKAQESVSGQDAAKT